MPPDQASPTFAHISTAICTRGKSITLIHHAVVFKRGRKVNNMMQIAETQQTKAKTILAISPDVTVASFTISVSVWASMTLTTSSSAF